MTCQGIPTALSLRGSEGDTLEHTVAKHPPLAGIFKNTDVAQSRVASSHISVRDVAVRTTAKKAVGNGGSSIKK